MARTRCGNSDIDDLIIFHNEVSSIGSHSHWLHSVIQVQKYYKAPGKKFLASMGLSRTVKLRQACFQILSSRAACRFLFVLQRPFSRGPGSRASSCKSDGAREVLHDRGILGWIDKDYWAWRVCCTCYGWRGSLTSGLYTTGLRVSAIRVHIVQNILSLSYHKILPWTQDRSIFIYIHCIPAGFYQCLCSSFSHLMKNKNEISRLVHGMQILEYNHLSKYALWAKHRFHFYVYVHCRKWKFWFSI